MKTYTKAVLAMLILATGCQSSPPSTSSRPASASGEHHFSGFLSTYADLKPAPDQNGVLLYMDRSRDYRPYTKIMLDPVQVLIEPGPEQVALAPETAKRMSESFHTSLQRTLEPSYQIVSAPGPDVLRLRAAITGVQPAKPKMGVTDFIPIKAAFNLGREVTGHGRRVAEMSGEAEVIAPDGKRALAAVANRKGNKSLPQGEEVNWNELQAISDFWAHGVRNRLDQLRGIRPMPNQ